MCMCVVCVHVCMCIVSCCTRGDAMVAKQQLVLSVCAEWVKDGRRACLMILTVFSLTKCTGIIKRVFKLCATKSVLVGSHRFREKNIIIIHLAVR